MSCPPQPIAPRATTSAAPAPPCIRNVRRLGMMTRSPAPNLVTAPGKPPPCDAHSRRAATVMQPLAVQPPTNQRNPPTRVPTIGGSRTDEKGRGPRGRTMGLDKRRTLGEYLWEPGFDPRRPDPRALPTEPAPRGPPPPDRRD